MICLKIREMTKIRAYLLQEEQKWSKFALKNQKTINDDDYVDDLKDILGDNLSYGGTA